MVTQFFAVTMADLFNNKPVFTLLQVATSIQKVLADRYTSTFWVKAEMNKLNHYSHSGHSYPELLEKKDGKVLAQLKANLWASDYQRVNKKFLEVLREPLKDGIKILFEASITFDPVYGLALRMHDIDPSYTLGDLEKEKALTLQRLVSEQLIHRNKLLPIPLLPKRIAIISVDTSKGYADFIKVLEENSWGYHFDHMLFPALLQGEKAIESITWQLNRIRKVTGHFDAVAIIRGGGGDIGLSCYNDYKLSKLVAEFPLPVITGIGHATNETVVEMVAHKNAITPTKIAEFLIQQFHNFSVPVKEAEKLILEWPVEFLRQQAGLVMQSSRLFASVTRNILKDNHSLLHRTVIGFNQHTRQRFKSEQLGQQHVLNTMQRQLPVILAMHQRQLVSFARDLKKDSEVKLSGAKNQLEIQSSYLGERARQTHREHLSRLALLENSLRQLDPKNVLKRGYSITLLNGKAITSYTEVRPADNIRTILFDGSIDSKIINSSNKEA
ncbi:MAG TPA: exodeoxyribonuclease VII large subunit [Flavitalea sp.]|nr:exodeoxyribonuclease VII large subunit [Flavitalea sp.]